MPSRISLQISNNDDGTLSLIVDTHNEECEIRIDRNFRIDFKKIRTLEQTCKIAKNLMDCPHCGRTIKKDAEKEG